MEKGQEIGASAGEKGSEQHAIDVRPGEHGAIGVVAGAAAEAPEERLAVVEEEPRKKSKRVAALDAFRGLTIVVYIYLLHMQ